MTDEERKEIARQIEDDMESLNKEISLLKGEVKPIPPDNALGRLTRVEAIQSKAIAEANLRTAQTKYGKLKRRRAHLEDPDFGICVLCEEPIPLARLMLLPESTRCVRCIERGGAGR